VSFSHACIAQFDNQTSSTVVIQDAKGNEMEVLLTAHGQYHCNGSVACTPQWRVAKKFDCIRTLIGGSYIEGCKIVAIDDLGRDSLESTINYQNIYGYTRRVCAADIDYYNANIVSQVYWHDAQGVFRGGFTTARKKCDSYNRRGEIN